MPSATMNTPRSGTMRKLSSFPDRMIPTSVRPAQVMCTRLRLGQEPVGDGDHSQHDDGGARPAPLPLLLGDRRGNRGPLGSRGLGGRRRDGGLGGRRRGARRRMGGGCWGWVGRATAGAPNAVLRSVALACAGGGHGGTAAAVATVSGRGAAGGGLVAGPGWGRVGGVAAGEGGGAATSA